MDFIMPPFRSSKCILDMSSNKNNNYFIPLPSTSNEHVQHKCCDYPPKVLGNLNQLRQNSRFCDVEIVAGDKIIKVRVAIVVCSKYYVSTIHVVGS